MTRVMTNKSPSAIDYGSVGCLSTVRPALLRDRSKLIVPRAMAFLLGISPAHRDRKLS